MTTPAHSFTSGVRPVGEGARVTTALALLGAILVFGVWGADPGGAVVAASLLLVPRSFFLYRWFRSLPPTVGAGLLGLSILLPFLERSLFGSPWGVAFGHLLLVVLIWRYQFPRLTVVDHRVLVAGSLALVGLSLTVDAAKPPAPVLVYGLLVVAALFRLHLVAEEHRVLDLARVRGWLRDDAEEIAGRAAGVELLPFLARLSLVVVATGALIAWALPFAARAADHAWDYLIDGEGDGEERPVLPEAPEGPIPFAIPPGAIGPSPFGPRLDRDEYVRRLESQDRLAALVRRQLGEEDPVNLFVRGECYDFLTSEGRWIRSRATVDRLRDTGDGEADGALSFGPRDPGAVFRDYLVPPGSDPTLLVVGPVARVSRPTLLRDGTGNLLREGERRGAGWTAATRRVFVGPGMRLDDPGPEFLRLPAGIDRKPLDELVHPILVSGTDPHFRVQAVRDLLLRRAVWYEGDEPPRGLADREPAPLAFDPIGFLERRRWGRNVDFATAYAMLLRAAGVPCRLATGYFGGGTPPETTFRAFRTWHGYAVVEVPFEGLGWVAFDPSPDSLSSLPPDALERIFQAPPEDRPDLAVTEIEKANRESLFRRIVGAIDGFVSGLLPGGPKSSVPGRIVSWLLVALIAGLALRAAIAVLDRSARVVARRGRGGPPPPPPVPFYEALLRLLARYGMRRRRSETPVEFARTVVTRMGPEYGEVARLTNAFCALRYGRRSPAAGAMEEYRARVDRLEEAFRAQFGSPRSRRRGAAAAGAALLVALLAAPGAGAADDLGPRIADLGARSAKMRAAAEAELLARGRAAVPALLDAVAPAAGAGAPSADVRRLVSDLDADDFAVREAASKALVELGAAAVPALEEVVARGSPEAARRARAALAEIARRAVRAPPEDPEERGRRLRTAFGLLARLAGPGEVDRLLAAAVGERGGEAFGAAVDALGAVLAREPALVEPMLARADRAERVVVARALAAAGGDAARPALLRLAFEPDPEVGEVAWRGLVTAEVIEETDRARLLLAERRGAEAEVVLVRVLGLCPGYPEAGLLLVRLLEDLGRGADALAVAEELRLPVAAREMLAARLLAAAGDREGARARLMDAAEADPGDPEPWLRAAELDLGAEPPRVGSALAALVAARERAPNDASIWGRIGTVRGELAGDRAGAAACFLRALELDPGNGDYEAALERYR